MKVPMIRAFLLLVAFILIFLSGTGGLSGSQSSVLEIIGFGGMTFSMLYGLLIFEGQEEKVHAYQKK